MSGTLRAELRKITTTRLWWIVLICIVVLSGGYAAGVALLQPGAGTAFDDPGIVRSVYNGGNPVARVLALVLGIATMGSEYRHQTLAATYLATPRRTRVLLGKAASLLLFGLLYGVASVLAGVAGRRCRSSWSTTVRSSSTGRTPGARSSSASARSRCGP